MDKLVSLTSIGQSLWYDNIQRSMLQNGDVEGMISRGEIKGMTSNPSIFQNAITKSSDYDVQLQTLAWSGLSAEEIFWKMAIDDVQIASDLFRSVYDATSHLDGYVSIEVNPNLAHNTNETVKEAVNLWKRIDRPNLMVKVPATKAGIPAIRNLIGMGINVNVTLIFSVDRYKEVAEAYILGLEDRLESGNSIANVSSVASFFVSRMDSKIDPMLGILRDDKKIDLNEYSELVGKAAIFNTRLAYIEFKSIFGTKRFKSLQEKGANFQRPLWASTSTKNPNYRDVIYVEELIGANTVNTVPPATLSAFLDHGKVLKTIDKNISQIPTFFSSLWDLGISMNDVTDSLEKEGVKAFNDAFNGLINVVDERQKVEISRLGNVDNKVHERLQIFKKKDFVKKLWAHDPGLWTDSVEGQREITQRMNWLEAPWNTQQVTSQTRGLLEELINEGYTHALVLGMGGSSLAPEVISKIYNSEHENGSGLHLSILDSTHPDEVAAALRNNPIGTTLFIVSSKSGTTGEINAFLNYFYDLAKKQLGNKAGAQFLAITDPGTKLETLAKEKDFRRIITADPQVGGRNSALTAFGLVPALLCGMDIEKLIKQTQFYARWLKPENDIENNPGLLLGTLLGESALAGKDKLTILADGEWTAFGAWMEQLIAESSGKDGKGILPITDEPLRLPNQYANDRLFVYLRKNGSLDASIADLVKSGHLVIQFNIESSHDLGYQFYLWETATAVACSIIGVNSFDQPNVQDAKTRTLAGIESYRKTGQFIIPDPEIKNEDYLVYANPEILFPSECSPLEAIRAFIKSSNIKNGYLGINAFVPRNETNIQKLALLRKNLEAEFGITTTMGFGPRYLHSTGQFHKGGPNNGIFVLITNTPEMDLAIPGEGITFAKFCFAQALGDEAALAAHGRKTLRIHFTSPEIKFS